MALTACINIVLKLFRMIEKAAAYMQGKGYGAKTVKQEVRLALSLLASPPVLAVDIGGNVGEYTDLLARHDRNIEIHVFEPSATNIKKLLERFSGCKSVSIIPCALSDHSGSATLFSNEPGSGLGSLAKRRLDHFDIQFDVHEEVRTLRFEDYWINTLRARPIDLVKIDVEGHELSVLRGFGEALGYVKLLQFEFGGCNIDSRSFFQDFWYLLSDQGFDLYRITPLGAQRVRRYREMDECFVTTNFMAVNRAPRVLRGGLLHGSP